MSESILLSIVIPVFNVEKYLEQCINSALQQTISKEIILVDDGSTDGSSSICDSFAQENPEVSVIHKPNGGLSSARNCGMNSAKGKYLFFLDSDDWIEPDSLVQLIKIAEQYDVDFIKFRSTRACHEDSEMNGPVYLEPARELSYGYYDRERIDKLIRPKSIITESLTMGPIVGACGSLYKADFITTNKIIFYEDVRYSEDMNFSANILNCTNSFYYTDFYPVYNYRYNQSSISHSFRNGRWDSMKNIIKHFEDDYSDNEYFESQSEGLSWFCVLQGLNEAKYLETKKERIKYRLKLLSDGDFPNLKLRRISKNLPFKLKIRMALIYTVSKSLHVFS